MRSMNIPDRPRVLVVDDDPRLRGLLMRYLDREGFDAVAAADGRELDQRLRRNHVDLIVLDLMLPGEDGLDICRCLRTSGVDTPIIMLTARGDEVERVIGLEAGADDYLPKPGSPRELVARMRAVLRRGRSAPGAPRPAGPQVSFGDCELNLATRELRRNGVLQHLSSGEFAVLAALVERPHQPLTRDRLMSLSRGRELAANERTIDVTLSKLRKLTEVDPGTPRYLQTVWGSGYVFVPNTGDS